MTVQKIWIYGSGGHAGVVFDVITSNISGYEVAGFIDDDPTKAGLIIFGHPIYGEGKLKAMLYKSGSLAKNMFIAIGDNIVRQKIAEKYYDFNFPNLLHSAAIVSNNASIGEGSLVLPLSIIEIGSKIGAHCIINNSALIGHGTSIGNYCHISGMVIIGGNVTVGDRTLVGLGACIAPGIKIGKRCKIVTGSVITRNVPDNSVMAGFPARDISRINTTFCK